MRHKFTRGTEGMEWSGGDNVEENLEWAFLASGMGRSLVVGLQDPSTD